MTVVPTNGVGGSPPKPSRVEVLNITPEQKKALSSLIGSLEEACAKKPEAIPVHKDKGSSSLPVQKISKPPTLKDIKRANRTIQKRDRELLLMKQALTDELMKATGVTGYKKEQRAKSGSVSSRLGSILQSQVEGILKSKSNLTEVEVFQLENQISDYVESLCKPVKTGESSDGKGGANSTEIDISNIKKDSKVLDDLKVKLKKKVSKRSKAIAAKQKLVRLILNDAAKELRDALLTNTLDFFDPKSPLLSASMKAELEDGSTTVLELLVKKELVDTKPSESLPKITHLMWRQFKTSVKTGWSRFKSGPARYVAKSVFSLGKQLVSNVLDATVFLPGNLVFEYRAVKKEVNAHKQCLIELNDKLKELNVDQSTVVDSSTTIEDFLSQIKDVPDVKNKQVLLEKFSDYQQALRKKTKYPRLKIAAKVGLEFFQITGNALWTTGVILTPFVPAVGVPLSIVGGSTYLYSTSTKILSELQMSHKASSELRTSADSVQELMDTLINELVNGGNVQKDADGLPLDDNQSSAAEEKRQSKMLTIYYQSLQGMGRAKSFSRHGMASFLEMNRMVHWLVSISCASAAVHGTAINESLLSNQLAPTSIAYDGMSGTIAGELGKTAFELGSFAVADRVYKKFVHEGYIDGVYQKPFKDMIRKMVSVMSALQENSDSEA